MTRIAAWLLAGLALTRIGSADQPSLALQVGADEPAAQAKGNANKTVPSTDAPSEAVSETPGKKASFPHDPAFDRYFDRKLLAKAWTDLDAELLTDVALELAEGERVLQRQHRGISAAELLVVAERVAVVVGKNEAAIKRLSRAASARGDKDWQKRVEALEKLAAASAGHVVAVDQVSLDQFSKHRELLHAIKRAAIAGDRPALEKIQEQLAAAQILSTDQKEQVKQHLKSVHKAVAAQDGDLAAVMSKLTAASRTDYSHATWGTGFGSAYYTLDGDPTFYFVTVTLQGNSGYFVRQVGGQGSLYNVNIDYTNGAGTITGNWALGGDSGSFTWNITPIGGFIGYWNGTSGKGNWNALASPTSSP